LVTMRRMGRVRQRGSGKTRRSAKISSPGSLVAGSSCHAVRASRRRSPGQLGGGPGPGQGPARRAVPAPGRAGGQPGRRRRRRRGGLRVGRRGAGALPGMRQPVIAGARPLPAAGGGRGGRWPPAADRAVGAPVPLHGLVLPACDVRRAGGGADRPLPAADPAAAGTAGPLRAGTGRAGRRPAGRRPGHPGALFDGAAAGHGAARPRGDGCPGGDRG